MNHKAGRKLIAFLCVLGLVLGVLPARTQAANQELKLSVPENKVLTYEYRKPQDFILLVKNTSDTAMTDITITPDLKNDDQKKWPFKTKQQSYEKTIETLAAGEEKELKFEFVERDDIDTARYTLEFSYTYKKGANEETGQIFFYVNTTAKPEEKPEEKPAEKPEENPGGSDTVDDGGGFSNGDAGFSGGGAATTSVTRVIVTGFTTNPEEVQAGSNFVLTIHLKNTSKSSGVKNMLFEISAPTEGADAATAAPAFLPASGSNAIYLDGIPANGTADISIELNAKSDLVCKPYNVDLSMKYEDGSGNELEANSSVSIPVKQDARYEFSKFEITPESVNVGDEANVMCNLYNLGRVKMYNVKAIFAGDCIEETEVFVGNVEPGGTASIDAMLSAIAPTDGTPDNITMTLSYENEDGDVEQEEKTFTLDVMEYSPSDMAGEIGEMEEPQGSNAGLRILGIVIVAAGVIAGVVIYRKKKKQKAMDIDEEELMNELDRSSEDEHQ